MSRVPGLPSAAIGADGMTVVAWTGRSAGGAGAYGARRTAARGFGEPFGLRKQRASVDDAAVQISADGDAIIAYRRLVERNHRIESRTVRRSGSRTPAVTLSGPGSSAYDPTFPPVAAGTLPPDPVLTWWRREPDRVQVSQAVGGRLFVSRNHTVAGGQRAEYAQLPDGTLLAASATSTAALLAARLPGGDFGEAVTIASGPGPFKIADVAVGPDGAVAVAWREFDGSTYRLRAAVAPPGGGFAQSQTLSSADERAVTAQVAITADGAVRVAYLAARPGNDNATSSGRLKLVTLGDEDPPAVVTAGSQTARNFELASDGRGGLTVAWHGTEGGFSSGAVFASAVTPSGRLGVRHLLTAPGETGYGLTLAAGPRGDALVAWVVGDERMRAAYRPPSG
ncbi:MAG: hypothetical protein MSC31_02835 [Solirubrobacteraceae bacterium MAG38_C4-C5]|nr:hypothetical protein [Candidatus Siliceabacter maunaloa]